jgi:hypothetical protein
MSSVTLQSFVEFVIDWDCRRVLVISREEDILGQLEVVILIVEEIITTYLQDLIRILI